MNIDKVSFQTNGEIAIENERRMAPTNAHLTTIFEYANGDSKISVAEARFALVVVCQWLFRQARPRFHCQRMTPFESVIAAAWCRVILRSMHLCTAVEFAAYLGQTYDTVIKKISSGTLKGEPGEIEIMSALAECERLGKSP